MAPRMEAMPTLGHALQSAMAQGVERLEAQLLLLHALGRTAQERAWLVAHDKETLSITSQHVWQDALRRRLAGEPLPYITGWAAFYGLDLQVDARVLCPRADTETLVDWALAILPPAARAIDLGTGSGAIALALKQQRPDVYVQARDISADALAVAQANAQRLGLNIAFSQGAWLQDSSEAFDAIVSNPPYVADADPHLAALAYEPLQALTSGADGLNDLRAIIAQAPACLKPDGWLLLEHGYDQAEAVRQLLQAKGFVEVQSRKDLVGIERCSGGRWANRGLLKKA
jgi:release factor glutamine methyltransferase